MPQFVRNLSAQTRKVEKLTSCFASEFVRKSVRPAMICRRGRVSNTETSAPKRAKPALHLSIFGDDICVAKNLLKRGVPFFRQCKADDGVEDWAAALPD